MKASRIRSFALAALLIVSAAVSACGDTAGGNNDTSSSVEDTTTPAETEYQYEYPDIDFGGEDFVILNTAQTYGFYSTLDFEEQTGDALDDAIYMRNRTVEDKFNLNFVINEDYTLDAANAALQKAVLSQEDIYDVAFLREIWLSSQLTDGMLLDLQDIDNFNFDEPWWDTETNEANRLGKSRAMYFAYTDISFTDFEGTLIIFFNENMMDDLNLEYPYQLVRDGKWTLDEYGKLMKAGANLNGQEKWTWQENGTATYGLITWDQGCYGLFMASGFDFVTVDDEGTAHLCEYTDGYVSQMQKIIEMFSVDGEYLYLADSGNNHYEMALKNGRTLTIIAQLKAANKYRDMEDSYGILPLPKKDEEQENYRCLRSYSYVMTMPITNQEPEKTAAVMDALGYLNYTTVMDDFYDGRVSQKSLRNEDSIEMLSIIRESRVMDIGAPYKWSTNIKEGLLACTKSKSTDIASKLEKYRPAIEASIEKVMEQLDK